jgi:pyruvate formate lyase activating enzyme
MSVSNKGLIFSIKKYSIHDGPGIRLTFFMKGCPLRCAWCHNPEGISAEPEMAERRDRIADNEFIVQECIGKSYSVDDLLNIAEKEKIFIDTSKGGITFSGGEPLLQIEFLREAMKCLKERGFHIAVDTSGYTRFENFTEIIPYTDLFLFDLKHLDDEMHVRFTGESNSIITGNFKKLVSSGKEIWIRVPLIPGVNDSAEYLKRLRDFIMEYRTPDVTQLHILPYHRTGGSKYGKLNIENRMPETAEPSSERIEEIRQLMTINGLIVKTGG